MRLSGKQLQLGEEGREWRERKGERKKEVTGGQSYFYNNIIINVVEKGKMRGG